VLGGTEPLSADGLGSASVELSATEIASGLSLETWSEYSGSSADYHELLSDGRTRWWTTEAGASRLIEPSNKVTQSYQIELGSPVLNLAGTSYESGQTIGVNWGLRENASTAGAHVQYSSDVLEKFGGLPVVTGFATKSSTYSGSDSGDVTSFFRSPIPWLDTNILSATPLGISSGVVAAAGSWTLVIAPTALEPPELTSDPYGSGYYDGSSLTLAAPMLAGKRIGRISSGSYESTGETLTVPAPFN